MLRCPSPSSGRSLLKTCLCCAPPIPRPSLWGIFLSTLQYRTSFPFAAQLHLSSISLPPNSILPDPFVRTRSVACPLPLRPSIIPLPCFVASQRPFLRTQLLEHLFDASTVVCTYSSFLPLLLIVSVHLSCSPLSPLRPPSIRFTQNALFLLLSSFLCP